MMASYDLLGQLQFDVRRDTQQYHRSNQAECLNQGKLP